MTIAENFADFICGLQLSQIPDDVRVATRRHILDSVGVMVATESVGIGTQGRDLAAHCGGKEEATVVGALERVPAPAAALANGMLAHALDFDDSHSASVTHPSSVLVPAVLAAGEMTGASAAECLVAAVAGYEINNSIGAVAGSALMERGFHTTALAGAFAAAAVAGRLMGLDSKGVTNAMGLVGSQASGVIEFLSDGTDAKQLHAGWAAHAGLVAAFLASRGLTGPASILEGPFGLYAAHLGRDSVATDGMTRRLGAVWTGREISYKAYPACHLVHTSVDAFLRLQKEQEFALDDVVGVTCFVPEYYVSRVLEPAANKLAPRTSYEAKFSLPYCLAAAACHGPLTLKTFEPASLSDRRVLDFARKVTYEVVAFPEFPEHYPGGVMVRLRGGRSFEGWERHNRQLVVADLLAKFHTNCDQRLGPKTTAALARRILAFGEEDKVAVSDTLAPLRYAGAVHAV